MRAPFILLLIAAFLPQAVTAQDTVVVRADNRPVWGAAPQLIEELRIGNLDGDPATTFASASALAIDDDGVIWVADGMSAEVRRFGSDGSFLSLVGSKGEGPGEFAGISGIKRMPDGRMVVWDAHGGRFSFFDTEGRFLSSSARRVGVVGMPAEMFQVDTAGALYHIWINRHGINDPARWFWYHLSEDGRLLDSLRIPPSGRATLGGQRYPFGDMGPPSPKTVSALSPHGYLVSGHTGEYALHRPLSDGRVLRIERTWEPVRMSRDERAQFTAHAAHVATLWDPDSGLGDDIPRDKPPFWALRIDGDARLWVARHSEGYKTPETPDQREYRAELARLRGSEPPPLEWWEPLVIDVIEPNGRFLGTLRFGSNRAVMLAAHDFSVWTVELGEFDEPYIVRYRIEPGG